MKRKHNGLIAIIIMGAVLLPTAIYAVYSSQIAGGMDTARLRAFPSDFTVPDTGVMKRLSILENEMVDIANPKTPKSTLDRDIRFWRYSSQNYHRYTANGQEQEEIDSKTAHALTFAFTSGEKKFCIIDGSFYTQGAELPGGGKIVQIESGRVRVKKGKSAQWISLSEMAKWGEIK
jgi:hypothetical protein